MKDYGQELRKIRSELNYTQKEIARRIGVPESSYSLAERTSNPDLKIIKKVCEFIDRPLGLFFSNDDDEMVVLSEKERQCLIAFKKMPLILQDEAIRAMNIILSAFSAGADIGKI